MMVHDWEVALKDEPQWAQRSKKITAKSSSCNQMATPKYGAPRASGTRG